MRRGLSYLVRWGFRLLLAIVALFVLAVGLLVLLEQRWGRYVVERSIEVLNGQLAVPVSTSDVSFTFFRNFPHASLHLRNVFIPSLLQQTAANSDTLLLAESVYLVFNPFALLKGHYRIERCRIVHGYLYLRQDLKGNTNYSIFQPHAQDTSSSSVSLALNKLSLSQIAIDYRDMQSQVRVAALIGDLEAGGVFGNRHAELAVKGEGLVELLKQGDFIYAKRQHFTLASHLISDQNLLTTPGSQLSLDRNRFYLTGSVNRATGRLELTASGQEIDLRSVLGFASQFQWQPPASIDVKGQLNALLTLSGNLQKGKRLRMEMELQGQNLSLRLHDAAYNIPRMQARFSNGEAASPASSSLDLLECAIEHRASTASLVFSMKNLLKPIFYAKFSASLHEGDIIPPIAKRYLQGYKSLNASGELLASLPSLDTISLALLRRPRFNLQCAFTDLSLRPYDSLELTDLSGSITVIENDLAKGAVSGRWDDWLFSVGASCKNVLAMATGHGKACWTVNTSLENADLKRLLAARFQRADTIQKANEPDFWLNTDRIMGSLSLRGCRYGALPLQNVKSQFTVSEREAQLQLIESNLLNGSLLGNITFRKNADNQALLFGTLRPAHCDLKALLQGLDNFGQQSITSQNVEGKLSGTITFHAPLDSAGVRMPDLQVQAAIAVEQGALTGMKGLDQLASFIALDDLRHIRFSTLSNTISLRNQRLHIPKMLINSSALNLSLSGEHHFNSAYQYRIALRLGDLLFNRLKSSRRDMQDNAIPSETKEGTHSLFLVLEGDSMRTAVRFDHAALREQIQQKIARERETLESMLQEEFGSAPSQSESPRQPAYTIEWDEGSDSAATKAKHPPKPQAKPNAPIRITWDDE